MTDLSFLKEFTKGDINKMVRYITMYLQYAPEILDKMKGDIIRKDWKSLAINAHSLKPQAEFMGNQEMKMLLETIEDKVRTNDLADIQTLLQKALLSHEEAAVELRAELPDE
jgi:HPt (histidine-containing phosphotransfer) domain-containing protein